MLPGLDGISILSAIRAQGLQTPVIVVTALEDDADREQALFLGANEYVVKPFRFNHLLACVRDYV